MADARVVISSEPTLGPEEVAQRTFPTSFRGYDQSDVRVFLRKVAEELRILRLREHELRQTIDELRQRAAAPPPPLDEAALTTALGEEAARVLQTAREAAADIRGKAEEKAARILREAEERGARVLREGEERAARLRADAESVMAERTEEAEQAAAGIRRAAEAEAQSVRAQAQSEAVAELDAARARGKEMVGEAQALRERVLSDLIRRRGMARVQIEQLRAGRERLLEAYRVVRRTLDEATEELSVAEAEARLAAEAAGRKAATAPEGTVGELEADLTTASRAELPLVEPSSPWTPRPEPQLEPEAADAVAGPPAVVRVLQATDVAAPAPSPRPPDPAPAPVEAPAAAPEPVEAPTPPVAAPALEPPGAVAPPAAPEPESQVDDLFARLRADREAEVARARKVLADEPAAAPAATDEAPAATDEAPQPDGTAGAPALADASEDAGAAGAEAVLERRDEVLDPAEERLARRLKRVLQDEQNDLLDRIRVTAVADLPGLTPQADAHVATFRDAAVPFVVDAARHGAAFASPGAPCPPDIDEAVSPVVDDLARELATPLRERLAAALSEAATGDDAQVAVDRLGSAYRQWKLERVGASTRHALTTAFNVGAYLATGSGTALRWVVDDDGRPCPDCDDNALAGGTRKGEAFPTGQLHPPAHAGCRCVITPA